MATIEEEETKKAMESRSQEGKNTPHTPPPTNTAALAGNCKEACSDDKGIRREGGKRGGGGGGGEDHFVNTCVEFVAVSEVVVQIHLALRCD